MKNILLLLVAVVPVAALLLLAGVVVGGWVLLEECFLKLRLSVGRLFGYQPAVPAVPAMAEPKEILRAPQLQLLTTEEEWETEGKEFSAWLDQWAELEHEFGQYPGLFRLHTAPEIPGLHGQLISDLCRPDAAGVFLQLLEPRADQQPAGTSWLLYLHIPTLHWLRVTETSGFYLLPDAVGEPYQFNGIQAGGSRLEVQAYPTEPVG